MVMLGSRNEEFSLEDFLGLGHQEVLDALGDAPAEARFPDRIFRCFLESLTLSFTGTSTDSFAIAGSGSISVNVGTGKAIGVGTRIKLARTAAPTTHFVEGIATAYDSVTGDATITLDNSAGSGTYDAWTMTVTGSQGDQGEQGDGDMTKDVYDPGNILEQLIGQTAAQFVYNKTFNAVQGTHHYEITGDGDYYFYPKAKIAETIQALRAQTIDSSVSFDVALKVNAATVASLTTVTNVEQTDNTITDDTVDENQMLWFTVSNWSGSGRGFVMVDTSKDIQQEVVTG